MASMRQIPAPIKLMTEPEIEHTELDDESIEKVTGFPEAPPIAITVYMGPPTTALAGGVDVNVMV